MRQLGGEVDKALRTARASGALWTLTVGLDRLVPIGLSRLWPRRRIPAEALRAQVEAILVSWGMPVDDASLTADHMLYADRRGIDSHGVAVLSHYNRLRETGSLTIDSRVEVVRDDEATALLDGGGGLGHLPAHRAMTMAIEKAAGHGVGAVGVRNSAHFGAAGSYARMAADEGMIGIVTSTAPPAVVPTFGSEAMLGTNPIAFSAPAETGAPFLLDMATSTVTMGRIATAARDGKPIPPGWALTPRGRPAIHAWRAFRRRRLTPLGGGTTRTGGHKGYGLGVAVEILSALLPGLPALAGGRFGTRIGHFALALEPGRFRNREMFGSDVGRLLDALRASTPGDPTRPVRVAGDRGRAAWEERSSAGIPLTRGVIEELRAVALASGVPFSLEPKR